MRLSKQQQADILHIVREELQAPVQISLYGSRTNDQRRGGDVDLLLEVTDPVPLLKKASIKLRLEQALGLPVDLLVSRAGEEATPFIKIAKSQAQPLESAA